MKILYLDENCSQRGFDDQSQVRIKMEALACQEIFDNAEQGNVTLAWSFMHQDETLQCPFPERKMAILRLSSICKLRVGPKESIYVKAKEYQKAWGFPAKDAVHLSCASYIKADYFITCDDGIIKKINRVENIELINPVDYIRKEEI